MLVEQLDRRPRQPADLQGVGKSWLASALGNKACATIAPCSISASRGCSPTSLWRARRPHPRLLRALGRVDLLILDDWGLDRSTPPPATTCWRSSRIATTAAPPSSPASSGRSMARPDRLRDTVFDRLVHNAHRQRREHASNPQTRPEVLSPWRCDMPLRSDNAKERCPHAHSRNNNNEDLKPRFKIDHRASPIQKSTSQETPSRPRHSKI